MSKTWQGVLLSSTARDPELLREPFKTMVRVLINELRKANINIAITYTIRTRREQEALYAKGRLPFEEVNKLLKEAGLPIMKDPKENTQVTVTKDSPHLFGVAIDVVPIVNGKADFNNAVLFNRIGQIAESLGLEWGGRWKDLYPPNGDMPHIELKNWRRYRELLDWKPVLE